MGARRGFELLDELGLLAEVLPEIVKLRGVEQPPEFPPEVDGWVHTRILLERLPYAGAPVTWTLAWGALLHVVGQPASFQHAPGDRIRFNGHVEVGVRIAEVARERLRFSNEDAAQIVALVKNHMRFGDVMEMRESTLKWFPAGCRGLRSIWRCIGWMPVLAMGICGCAEFAKERFLPKY